MQEDAPRDVKERSKDGHWWEDTERGHLGLSQMECIKRGFRFKETWWQMLLAEMLTQHFMVFSGWHRIWTLAQVQAIGRHIIALIGSIRHSLICTTNTEYTGCQLSIFRTILARNMKIPRLLGLGIMVQWTMMEELPRLYQVVKLIWETVQRISHSIQCVHLDDLLGLVSGWSTTRSRGNHRISAPSSMSRNIWWALRSSFLEKA